MCKEPGDTKASGWSKGELRVTSSTEPLSVCFMKYHSQRREGGGSRISWIKEPLRFSLSPFNPPPRSRRPLSLFSFLPPQIDPLIRQSWHDTHVCVCWGDFRMRLQKAERMGRTGWARCRCVYVFEGLVHVCVLGREGWGVQDCQDNDHDSRPTDSPPAVLLSPCLRFGFGTRFEPRQWFPNAAELPGFFSLWAAIRRAKRLLAAQSLVLLTSGQCRAFLLNLINQPLHSKTHTDLTPAFMICPQGSY